MKKIIFVLLFLLPLSAHANLVKLPDDDKVFFVQENYRRHIPTAEIFEESGYKWSDIKVQNQITAKECYLVKASSDKVYYLQNKVIYPIRDIPTFNRYRFEWKDLQIIVDKELATYQIGNEFFITQNNEVVWIGGTFISQAEMDAMAVWRGVKINYASELKRQYREQIEILNEQIKNLWVEFITATPQRKTEIDNIIRELQNTRIELEKKLF